MNTGKRDIWLAAAMNGLLWACVPPLPGEGDDPYRNHGEDDDGDHEAAPPPEDLATQGEDSPSVGGPFFPPAPFAPPPPFQPPGSGGTGGRAAFVGPLHSAPIPPAPLSGGTLQIIADGTMAVVSDPDRDKIFLVDLKTDVVKASFVLDRGDEPGRAVEDKKGLVHVVLRRGGAVIALDPATGTIESRTDVCPAPRGIDLDDDTGHLFIACAGGEVVRMVPGSQSGREVWHLDRDLRDVVVTADRVLVSRFRSAEILFLDKQDGRVLRRVTPTARPFGGARVTVAWRMRRNPAGGAIMVHQESSTTTLSTLPGAYATAGCEAAIVKTSVTEIAANGTVTTSAPIGNTVLPVDLVAFSGGDGLLVGVLSAGHTPPTVTGTRHSLAWLARNYIMDPRSGCVTPPPFVLPPPTPEPGEPPPIMVDFRLPSGEPVALGMDARNRLIVQTRQPAALEFVNQGGRSLSLDSTSVQDTGYAIFHTATSAGIACASCHPEGSEDGHTWQFKGLGSRRTQDLRGGMSTTAPFHWEGDMPTLERLMEQVFTGRMGGGQLGSGHVAALGRWMDSLKTIPQGAPRNPDAVARGQALFNDKQVACASCHNGPSLTNNATVDVGTGLRLQVPSLVGVAFRAPFMHNGCGKTLAARFDPTCGGTKHGDVSHLRDSQLGDLVAYLETL